MSGRVLTDPSLLPYYLTVRQVAALCQRSTRTVQSYCADGTWVRGQHWTRPASMTRGGRRFLRDAIVSWLNGDVRGSLPLPSKSKANIRMSPALAAVLQREAN